jgi:Methyltransferase FkbM domain
MDLANYNPSMLPLLVDAEIFKDEPFFLIDVGCSGGIDSIWRLFKSQLAGVGFDPQQGEIARLRAQESNPNVKYVPALVGLDAEHDFHVRKRQQADGRSRYFEPMLRSSAAALWKRGSALQSNVVGQELTSAKIGLAEYVRSGAIGYVDFIKIDTDGSDLEAAISASQMIRPCHVLGFMIETPFSGSHEDTANSFHNIDRFMRQHGFMLYVLALRQYSRATLPAPFVYDIPAQTISGQVQWADAVYLRDGAAAEYGLIWDEELSPVALLKLAALYELFQLPDCAAELIDSHCDRIAALIEPDKLLDKLTPPLNGEQLSYRDYIAAFGDNPEQFFPHQHTEPPMCDRKARQPPWFWSRISARFRRGSMMASRAAHLGRK